MEVLRHCFLVHRILEGRIEDTLVGIAIVRAQSGVQLQIAEVKAIHNGHSIWSQFGEHCFQAILQPGEIRIGQVNELWNKNILS